jgi:hypothetical protein
MSSDNPAFKNSLNIDKYNTRRGSIPEMGSLISWLLISELFP